jgi:hypothetical protein
VGYNLYLVKRGNWWDADARFGREEWDRLQAFRLPETYGTNGMPVPASPVRPGFFAAALRPAREFFARRSIRRSMRGVVCPFEVGDLVRTTLRTGGVVIAVDPTANHGLDSIKVRFPDGFVLGSFFVGHGFRKEA